MPSPAAAAEFVEGHTAPADRCGIWPLWLCPVRHVPLPGAGGAGYGFPYQAREETPPGGIWVSSSRVFLSSFRQKTVRRKKNSLSLLLPPKHQIIIIKKKNRSTSESTAGPSRTSAGRG